MTLVKPDPNFLNEQRIPVYRTKELGVSRSAETLRRWIEDGIRSSVTGDVVQLEGCYEGNTLCTTKEAYRRFLAKLNGFEPEEA